MNDRYCHHLMVPDAQVFWFLHGLIKNSRDLELIQAVCVQMREILSRNQNETFGDGSFTVDTWYKAVHMLKIFDPYSQHNKQLDASYFDPYSQHNKQLDASYFDDDLPF